MSRDRALVDARCGVRPVTPVQESSVAGIAEDTFHQAKTGATALTNTAAGETFTVSNATYARLNKHHFRIEGRLSHTDSLALIGRTWRTGGAR